VYAIVQEFARSQFTRFVRYFAFSCVAWYIRPMAPRREPRPKPPADIAVQDLGDAIVTVPGDGVMIAEYHNGRPGPPTKAIQAAARLAYLPRLKFLTDMIDGELERKVTILGAKDKKTTIIVKPTFQERLEAMKELGKIAQLHNPPAEVGSDTGSAAFVSRALNALTQLAAGMAAGRGEEARVVDARPTESGPSAG